MSGKPNKYLKDLVEHIEYIPNSAHFLLSEEVFRKSYSFELKDVLGLFIYCHLARFRDECHTYPVGMTMEQWDCILDKMVEAFRLYNTVDFPSKTQEKKIKHGMKLFVKYFSHLWY